jgi:hypothetical protein
MQGVHCSVGASGVSSSTAAGQNEVLPNLDASNQASESPDAVQCVASLDGTDLQMLSEEQVRTCLLGRSAADAPPTEASGLPVMR